MSRVTRRPSEAAALEVCEEPIDEVQLMKHVSFFTDQAGLAKPALRLVEAPGHEMELRVGARECRCASHCEGVGVLLGRRHETLGLGQLTRRDGILRLTNRPDRHPSR